MELFALASKCIAESADIFECSFHNISFFHAAMPRMGMIDLETDQATGYLNGVVIKD